MLIREEYLCKANEVCRHNTTNNAKNHLKFWSRKINIKKTKVQTWVNLLYRYQEVKFYLTRYYVWHNTFFCLSLCGNCKEWI